MSDTPSNAVFLVAAISVIIFSIVGVGVMTGIIPSDVLTAETKNGSKSAANRVQPLCAGCARIEQMSLRMSAQASAVPAFENERPPVESLRYEVVARLADGSARVYSYSAQPEFRVGDTVKIDGEALRAD